MRKTGNILIAKEACKKMKTKMKISSAIFRKKKSGGKILRGLYANFVQKFVNTFCCRVLYNPETDLKLSRLLIGMKKIQIGIS